MKHILLFLSLQLFGFSLFAQKTYQRSLGETGDDNAYDLVIDEMGDIVLAGVSTSFSTTKSGYLNKVDTVGKLVWSKVYKAEQNVIFRVVKQARTGGFIIAGNTNAYGAGRKDALLLKTDADGNIEWSKTYGGEFHDYGFDVESTLDGGYILVGETNSFDVSGSDVFVVKVGPKGEVEWSKAYGGPNVEFSSGIVELLDGYVFSSETNSHGAGSWDVALTKISKTGEVLWYSVFGGTKDDFCYSIDLDPKNLDVYMTGSSSSFGMGGRDMYVFQVNKKGDLENAKSIGEGYDEQGHVIRVLPDGGLAIAGFTNSFNGHLNAEDLFLVRFSHGLHLRWSKIMGGVFGDYALGMQVDSTGNFYIAGETYSYNNRSDKDAYLVKMEDDPRASNCEQIRVQATPLKVTDEVKVNKYQPNIRDLEPKVSNAPFLVEQVLTLETIICTDNNTLIESDRRK